MLKWHENLYIGETVRDADKIRCRLDEGKLVPFIHLITLSENPEHLLEIHPAALLVQEPLRESCPTIVGMAKGKDEAIELVSFILQEIYGETGAFSVKEYFKNR